MGPGLLPHVSLLQRQQEPGDCPSPCTSLSSSVLSEREMGTEGNIHFSRCRPAGGCMNSAGRKPHFLTCSVPNSCATVIGWIIAPFPPKISTPWSLVLVNMLPCLGGGKKKTFCFLFFVFCLAEPRGLWDLHSLTRDQVSAVTALSPNHWTAREFPKEDFVDVIKFKIFFKLK